MQRKGNRLIVYWFTLPCLLTKVTFRQRCCLLQTDVSLFLSVQIYVIVGRQDGDTGRILRLLSSSSVPLSHIFEQKERETHQSEEDNIVVETSLLLINKEE